MKESEPYEVKSFGTAPYFVFCDHASNHIPEDYACLGVSADVLQTHIAWDPGAGDLALAMAERFETTVLLSGFSRLLIDPNRALDQEGLVPDCADQIPVPGNQNLSYDERCRRIETFFEPYHRQLDEELSRIEELGTQPFVVSVHSFTPRMMGTYEDRPWHIGILWRHDPPTARNILQLLREETDYTIGDNEPYDARVFNYTVDRHIAPRKLRHVTLEIRQDLLETPQQTDQMADCLASVIRRL